MLAFSNHAGLLGKCTPGFLNIAFVQVVGMHVCICVHMHVYTCVYVCVCVCVCVCTHACVCMCVSLSQTLYFLIALNYNY